MTQHVRLNKPINSNEVPALCSPSTMNAYLITIPTEKSFLYRQACNVEGEGYTAQPSK